MCSPRAARGRAASRSDTCRGSSSSGGRSGGRSRLRGTRARGSPPPARLASRPGSSESVARLRDQAGRLERAAVQRRQRAVCEVEVDPLARPAPPRIEADTEERAGDEPEREEATTSHCSWLRLALRRRLRLGNRLAEASLEVVEDEARRRLGSRRSCDRSSPSRTTKRLPSAVATSRWVASSPAVSSNSTWRLRRCFARSSGTVDATTSPSAPTITADSTCDEISVSSESAVLPSVIAERLASHDARGLLEVLRRPRHASRRHDRVLRAPLVRAAPLPRPRPARLCGPGGRVELPRHRAEQGVSSSSVEGILEVVRSIGTTPRRSA